MEEHDHVILLVSRAGRYGAFCVLSIASTYRLRLLPMYSGRGGIYIMTPVVGDHGFVVLIVHLNGADGDTQALSLVHHTYILRI